MSENASLLLEWIDALFPSFRRRAKFRAAWGLEGDKDGWLASRAFDLSKSSSCAQWVGDKAWVDLELPRIFSTIDTTVSPIGSQMLYKRLREYQFDGDESSNRNETYDAFRSDSALREECQLALTALDTNAAALVADFVMGPLPEASKYRFAVFSLAGASLATLVLTFVFSLTIWLWLAVLAANIALIAKMSLSVNKFAGGLLTCSQMLNVAERLAKARTDKRVVALQRLNADRTLRKKLRKQIGLFALVSSDHVPLAQFFMALNVCFLVKPMAYFHTIKKIAMSRQEWKSTYELIGSIDASIAIANFLHRMPRHCRPNVSTERLISVDGMYHPLLAKSVDCSVRLNNRSALVTGSNMTGKTTFVKTVAINIIFGNTIGVCLAVAATIPTSSVMTSIRSDHSIESGRSRYASEVDTIIQMHRALSRNECRVFVIDEPFSGTNTLERIAIAKALLNAMSADAQLMVTTHDVELQGLLADTFDLFHFREDPDVEGFFDYKLRTGASTERNAIKVLARMGLPEPILKSALAHIERQSTERLRSLRPDS